MYAVLCLFRFFIYVSCPSVVLSLVIPVCMSYVRSLVRWFVRGVVLSFFRFAHSVFLSVVRSCVSLFFLYYGIMC